MKNNESAMKTNSFQEESSKSAIKANCSECKYCIFQDEGYSNYTVENTMFECAKKLHPSGTFDRFYGEEIRL